MGPMCVFMGVLALIICSFESWTLIKTRKPVFNWGFIKYWLLSVLGFAFSGIALMLFFLYAGVRSLTTLIPVTAFILVITSPAIGLIVAIRRKTSGMR